MSAARRRGAGRLAALAPLALLAALTTCAKAAAPERSAASATIEVALADDEGGAAKVVESQAIFRDHESEGDDLRAPEPAAAPAAAPPPAVEAEKKEAIVARKTISSTGTGIGALGLLGAGGRASKLFGDSGDDDSDYAVLADGSGGGGASVEGGHLGRRKGKADAFAARGHDKDAVNAKSTLAKQAEEAKPQAPAESPREEAPEDLPAPGGGGDDGCMVEPSEAPMPRRCHLAPTYHAGRAAWQRRLRAVAELPPALAQAVLDPAGRIALAPPDDAALALDARLDRDHIDGPGRVWLRVVLRSTERWGMRRPPFDLAVVVGAAAVARPDDAACRALTALVARVEPQDRLSLLTGATPLLDGVSGTEAAARIGALCAAGLPAPDATVAVQHAAARALLAEHAAAKHRVAGTRLVVALIGAGDADAALEASAHQGAQEPSLTSLLLLDDGEAADLWWQVADVGHGALEVGALGEEPAAARALWDAWGRVVARLVRVDLRLSPGVVAHRVVGSRVLGAAETRAVRQRELAIDQNLARVAGVAADRKDDGEGMTMLIPAFLGSDEHSIDVLLEVPGPGPVVDVVVDYKDLVRMRNAKAMARAALAVLPRRVGVATDLGEAQRQRADKVRFVQGLRDATASGNLGAAVQAAPPAWLEAGTWALLQRAAAQAEATPTLRPALTALLDAWLAQGNGCRVVAAGASGGR